MKQDDARSSIGNSQEVRVFQTLYPCLAAFLIKEGNEFLGCARSRNGVIYRFPECPDLREDVKRYYSDEGALVDACRFGEIVTYLVARGMAA